MSEDSESDVESQQKRKISKLKDSSNEDDNDDSECDVISKKKRKLIKLEDSPEYSSSGSDIVASSSSITQRRFRMKPVIEDSDSDNSNSSSSSSSFEIRRKTNRLPRIISDVDSDSSNSVVIRRNRRRAPPRVFSDDNTDVSSQWNTDVSDEEISNKSTDTILVNFDSDSSDGQTEKCPICLISLNKNQEIGTPEICEHMFCAECIQEWSKSMNTCPVDRQPYNLIYVRKNLNGIVYREIEIEPPNQQQPQQAEVLLDIDAVYEDATFCEICGRCDREERMLLCDGCDLGFHLECLHPPLDEIPGGTWYCASCEVDEDYQPIQNNRIRILRLIPRTRHSERVRHRIQNNRTLAEFAATTTLSTNETNHTQLVTSTTRNYQNNQRKRQTTKKKRRKRQRYKTIYQIDDKTGETLMVKKRIKKRIKKRRKSRKQRQNPNNVPKTVKGRLASQLGICAPRTTPQILPEMRIQRNNSNIVGVQRQQAGIPILHLFGERNELDYFPQSDNENDNDVFSNTSNGPNVLIRRPPNRNDILAFRRRNRLKNISIPNQVSTTTNILDNILDMQTKFYSKNTIFNIDKNGKFTMKNKNDNNNNNNHINFNDFNQVIRQRTASCSNNNRNNDSLPSSSRHDDNYQNNTNNSTPTSTVDTSTTNSNNTNNNDSNNDNNQSQDQRNIGHFNTVIDEKRKDRKTKNSDISENSTRSNTPYSGESEIDIYSDIETVSTSKVDDNDIKQQSPIQLQQQDHTNDDDDDGNDSESDMIIDTDKANLESEDNTKEETTVTSTVDNNSDSISMNTITSLAHSTTEIQSEAVQSSNQKDSFMDKDDDEREDDDSEDGCPNFNIYSKESKNLAKNIDISIPNENNQIEETNQVEEISSSPAVDTIIVSNISIPKENTDNTIKIETKKPTNSGLYSDSEDETIVKKNINSFAINDIRNMTEDISEEERSYTPCLDEREPIQQGIEGLDTEMISDEDRNDFDESHDIKTETDGDALEINAKESELDFTRPEDCEEGEIVDKSKIKKVEDSKKVNDIKKELKQEINDSGDKENDNQSKESAFKKLSKNNKERNYRDKDKDKDRSRSRSKDRKNKNDKDFKKEKKKEKRKEMERYNVRAVVAERPKRLKDRFGRDLRCSRSTKSRSISFEKSPSRNRRSSSKTHRSLSRNRKSLTPPPPPPVSSSSSRNRRSPSREFTTTITRKKQSQQQQQQQQQRGRSRTRRSRSHSSTERKRSRSKTTKKRKRSSSYERSRRHKSRDRSKTKKSKRSRSRHRSSRSITPKKHRKDWTRRHSREWSPSVSRSRSPEPRHFTPSWTPPRLMDNTVKPHNLTVILTNDSNNKKKKDKKKKSEKKTKENDKQKKKKRSDRTPPPSKEVFASGDNILVSVSFNKENETRDVSTTKKKKESEEIVKKIRKDKRPKTIKPIKKRDLSGVKPVAIIDLERSPFKELTPSPKDIIVLSDSDNDTNIQKNICDSSSQQVVSPEHCCGPKTPPEPQVKFTLTAKVPQLRNISNPLHEPDDIEPETDNQQVDGLHKGPNTPPEPPNSPPSSPDAYDPFEPTKSRSPSPEPLQNNQTNNVLNLDNNRDNLIETRSNISEIIDKTNNSLNPTPDVLQSHTPPLADVQPADSQSSIHESPESNIGKSPECLNQNQTLQINQTTNFSINTTKSNIQTTFSTVPTSVITSTPINTNLSSSSSSSSSSTRMNLLNTTVLTTSNPTTTTTLQNRNILSNTIKSSPIKISPNKPTTITTNTTTTTTLSSSSSSSSSLNTRKPNNNRNQNSGGSNNNNNNNNNNESTNDNSINLDSPYSPGSSDYEGLFEPPAESPIKTKPPTTSNISNNTNNNNNNNNNNNSGNNSSVGNKTVKSPAKLQSAFDALFGSPMNKMIKSKSNEKSTNSNSNNNNKFNNNNKKSLPSLQSQPSLPPPLTTSSSSIGCKTKASKQVGIKFDEDSLKILDELPSSAVEMQVKDKFLKKLNRQERVVEEVKLVLKPHYNKKHINKEEYKDILRRAVPKICHNKSGEINPTKIKNLIEAYVKKIRHSKKVTSSSSVNPQKA